ncbi:hypothetical protein WJX82_004309 [Trebouxia sp. C0006]
MGSPSPGGESPPNLTRFSARVGALLEVTQEVQMTLQSIDAHVPARLGDGLSEITTGLGRLRRDIDQAAGWGVTAGIVANSIIVAISIALLLCAKANFHKAEQSTYYRGFQSMTNYNAGYACFTGNTSIFQGRYCQKFSLTCATANNATAIGTTGDSVQQQLVPIIETLDACDAFAGFKTDPRGVDGQGSFSPAPISSAFLNFSQQNIIADNRLFSNQYDWTCGFLFLGVTGVVGILAPTSIKTYGQKKYEGWAFASGLLIIAFVTVCVVIVKKNDL